MMIPKQPLSRRTILRGIGGAGMAVPFLEAMRPRVARAQTAPVRRFIAFFYPCGTDPRKWNPVAGPLNTTTVSECLQDLKGFAAEGIWPAESAALLSEVTAVTGIDHSGVCTDIHRPAMALAAHKGTTDPNTPSVPTLDQFLADQLQGTTPYRNLALSATPSTDIGQGNISFRTGGQVSSVTRNPRDLFNTLFPAGSMTGGGATAEERARRRQKSVLDYVLEDANRLNGKLGAGDKQRLGQYLQAVSEVEKQVIVVTPPPATCTAPTQPATGGNWHSKSKAFIDLMVLAMACDKTRIATLQYSDSWGVNYSDYALGSGMEALGTWSDHFISHKLDDTDRATDLDGLPRADAQRIADARVVTTSRFKVRRFAYLLSALKRTAGVNGGSLLDESIVMFTSENGDGDSHSRKNMPILLAGHAGGFQTGRVVAATNLSTGALHASIIKRLGIEVTTYGNPAGSPIADL
jgi:hypothetical protein